MWFLQLIYPVVAILAVILVQIHGVVLAIQFLWKLEKSSGKSVEEGLED